MNEQEQIDLINQIINKNKGSLKPLSKNFIFWGLLISLMSLVHYYFPGIIQSTKYSSLLFWTITPVLGMIFTVYLNIKAREKQGYTTYIGRALKIIWGVFNIAWLLIVVKSLMQHQTPVWDILFLLGIVLVMSGFLVRSNAILFGGGICVLTVILESSPLLLEPLLVNAWVCFFGMFIPGIIIYYSKKDV